MTDEIAQLKAQVAGQRLVLFRLLTAYPSFRIRQMVASARRGLEFVEGGGETIPSSGPADLAAMAAELALLEDALANRVEHEVETS